jgi:nitroimidazol reductase NimA-like FMN-containing flavoprotein (pyridoxamine 5'-phosphate oxidase superfamily)
MTSTWERVESLDPADCMSLLGSVRWGRVAWVAPEGPQVLPVNHKVLDGNVVFRTDLYTSVAEGTRTGTVAFEADELDDRMQFGWSVLVVGQAEHIEDHGEAVALFGRMGQPWAPGSRPLVARITPLQVTGRRFLKS